MDREVERERGRKRERQNREGKRQRKRRDKEGMARVRKGENIKTGNRVRTKSKYCKHNIFQ